MNFKRQPWMRDVETRLAFTLTHQQKIALQGQPAPAGPKRWQMREAFGKEVQGKHSMS